MQQESAEQQRYDDQQNDQLLLVDLVAFDHCQEVWKTCWCSATTVLLTSCMCTSVADPHAHHAMHTWILTGTARCHKRPCAVYLTPTC